MDRADMGEIDLGVVPSGGPQRARQEASLARTGLDNNRPRAVAEDGSVGDGFERIPFRNDRAGHHQDPALARGDAAQGVVDPGKPAHARHLDVDRGTLSSELVLHDRRRRGLVEVPGRNADDDPIQVQGGDLRGRERSPSSLRNQI